MATDTTKKQSRWNKFWVGLLLVLGCVFLALGSIAVWLEYTLLDTDEYVNTVAPLTQEHEVAEALSTFVVDEVISETNAQDELTTLLRRNLGPEAASFSGAVASSIEPAAVRAVDQFIESDEFATLWKEANREAHLVALAAIKEDDNDILVQSDGRIELDLKPTIDKVAADVSGVAGVDISVPDDIGKVELFRDEKLAAAQTGARVLQAVSWILPILMAILFALAIWVSRDRWRTVMYVGIGALIVSLLTVVALRFTRDEVSENVADRDLPQPAVETIWDTLMRNLEAQTWVVMIVGLAVVVLGAAMGDSDWARSLRASLAERGNGAGGRGLQRFATEHTGWMRLIGVAVGIGLLLIWPEPSILAAFVIVALTVLYLIGVEYLNGAPHAAGAA